MTDPLGHGRGRREPTGTCARRRSRTMFRTSSCRAEPTGDSKARSGARDDVFRRFPAIDRRCRIAHLVGAGWTLAAQAVPGRLARAAPLARAGVIVAAAVVVSRRREVLAGHPVVGLLHALSPLRWRMPARLGGWLAFVALHSDAREVPGARDADTDRALAEAGWLGWSPLNGARPRPSSGLRPPKPTGTPRSSRPARTPPRGSPPRKLNGTPRSSRRGRRPMSG